MGNKSVDVAEINTQLDEKFYSKEYIDGKVGKDTNNALNIPMGSTEQRPTEKVPDYAYLRYNTSTDTYEGSPDGVVWRSIGAGSSGSSAMLVHDNVVSKSYEIEKGQNAISAGPISIADAVSVTINKGSTWVIV